MKNILTLFSALLFTFCSYSQFNQGNEPAIDDGLTLYVIDSMAPSYDDVIGSGVTWDYSSFGGYPNEERTLTVLDPANTSYSTQFPTAQKALDIENFILNFTYSSATERVSPGFVYTDDDIGDVVVVFDTDESIQYEYPFALGENFTDTYEGTASFAIGSSNASGEFRAEVDGQGTLKLADGNDFTNVIRYKLSDSTLTSNPLSGGDITLKRVQYEYYDLANSSLPIFVHTNVEIAALQTEFSLVMSSVEPTITASLEENVLSSAVVYPNPVSETINISLKNEFVNTKVSVVDAMGREVLNQPIESDFTTLDVTHLEEGMYFVKISNGDFVETKTVVIK